MSDKDKDNIRDFVTALSRGDHEAATVSANAVITDKTAAITAAATQDLEEGNPERARRNRLGGGNAAANQRIKTKKAARLGEDSDEVDADEVDTDDVSES